MKKILLGKRTLTSSLYVLLIIIWGTYFLSAHSFELYLKHIGVPLTMIFGSFIAGFTSEGGGAIAFPIFSKVLHIDPFTARNFSFAIQSVGMTFAMLTIFIRKIPIEKRVLVFASLGGMIGITIGTFFIVPHISLSYVKLIFTLVVTSFGIALFFKNFVFSFQERSQISDYSVRDSFFLILVGIAGGVISSIIGTGVDIITFSIVSLLYCLDEKVSTPTSVCIMALNSIYGFFLHAGVVRDFTPLTFEYWILCVPIVAFFAPIGAVYCHKVSRKFIVVFLLFLIMLEFISTIIIFKFDPASLTLSLIVLLASLVFYAFIIWLARRINLRRNES